MVEKSPPVSTEQENLPNLLWGIANGHLVFRAASAVFLLVVILFAGRSTIRRWELWGAFAVIILSIFYDWLLGFWIWGWHGKARLSLFRIGTRGRIRLRNESVYPLHPLLVDVAVLAFLVYWTGGLASPFVILYSMVSATGDVAMTSSQKRPWFVAALLVSYAIGTVVPVIHPGGVGDVVTVCPTGVGSYRIGVYLVTVAMQGALLLLLGEVIGRTARRLLGNGG